MLKHPKFPNLKVRQTKLLPLKIYFYLFLCCCSLFYFMLFIICYCILCYNSPFFIITSVYFSCFVTFVCISFKIFKRHIQINIYIFFNILTFNYPKPLFTSHSNIQKSDFYLFYFFIFLLLLLYFIILYIFYLFYFICCNFILCCYYF